VDLYITGYLFIFLFFELYYKILVQAHSIYDICNTDELNQLGRFKRFCSQDKETKSFLVSTFPSKCVLFLEGKKKKKKVCNKLRINSWVREYLKVKKTKSS
jgi:hypothetical protein